MHSKGYAAPETMAAAERARLLIEEAEALGEPPEDPLLLFAVLYGFWAANYVGFNGDVLRDLATQFLALAEKQTATAPLMIGHRLNGNSLAFTGNIAAGRAHYDQAIALYDPVKHRPLATRFGQDIAVVTLSSRSLAQWLLGYPEAARTDAARALSRAREIAHPGTLMYALFMVVLVHTYCGDYIAAGTEAQELVGLADEKGAVFWKTGAMMIQGRLFALTSRISDAILMMTSAITTWRSTGSTLWTPIHLSYLAMANAKLGQVKEAWHYIKLARSNIETTNERWCEADIHRTAGEIALMSPDQDVARAEAHFEHALAIARQQQAKSWELRAAMSMARLWRDQGRCDEARDLLAPVYGWFTEGFDTLDLKQAKALLDELAA